MLKRFQSVLKHVSVSFIFIVNIRLRFKMRKRFPHRQILSFGYVHLLQKIIIQQKYLMLEK